MNREQLRQAADREALAIWDRAKLPGDGAVWIADAIVRVAERYARDEDRFSAVVEAKRECTRLAAEDLEALVLIEKGLMYLLGLFLAYEVIVELVNARPRWQR